jgi:hypothetical protein
MPQAEGPCHGQQARPLAQRDARHDRDHRRAHIGHRPDHAHLPAGKPPVKHQGAGPACQSAGQSPGDRPEGWPRAAGHDQSGPGQHGGDFGYATVSERAIAEGVDRLAQVISEL